MNRKLIAILGPTAVGKTALSIKLALHFDTEIISCDSRQIYRELNVGTAKPPNKELNLCPHHFINHISIQHSYSAGKYEKEALERLESIYKKNSIALLAGGTGLFHRALTVGLDKLPPKNLKIRKKLEDIYKKRGINKLQVLLQQKDQETFRMIDHQNPRRLIRALEIIISTGNPPSAFRRQASAKRSFHTINIGLEIEREVLYERINGRVDQMVEQGLEQEARSLYAYKDLPALETIGYQEWMAYFDNKIPREEAIRLIKRNSRRYAKRQMTWFKKDDSIHWFNVNEQDKVIPWLEKQLSSQC